MTPVDVCDLLYRTEWSRWWKAYTRATAIGFTVVEYIEQVGATVPAYVEYSIGRWEDGQYKVTNDWMAS